MFYSIVEQTKKSEMFVPILETLWQVDGLHLFESARHLIGTFRQKLFMNAAPTRIINDKKATYIHTKHADGTHNNPIFIIYIGLN